jgi:hypothetical protein
VYDAHPIADGRDLLASAIEAHGGAERWDRLQALELRYRAGGLAFAMKLRGLRPRSFDARVTTTEPRVRLRSFPRDGLRGELEGGSVRIADDWGREIAARERPAEAFRSPRRLIRWDDLDDLYFSAYAIWGYATAPFHLRGEGIELAELEPWQEQGATWRRLRARYPTGLPVHCREQVFHYDENGLLRRHDYTAEAFGGWAKAAHYSYDHREFGGISFPTRRRVHPRRGDGRPIRAVTIIAIELQSVEPVERAS